MERGILSMRLFNHARGALYLDNTKQTQGQHSIYYLCSFHGTTHMERGILSTLCQPIIREII